MHFIDCPIVCAFGHLGRSSTVGRGTIGRTTRNMLLPTTSIDNRPSHSGYGNCGGYRTDCATYWTTARLKTCAKTTGGSTRATVCCCHFFPNWPICGTSVSEDSGTTQTAMTVTASAPGTTTTNAPLTSALTNWTGSRNATPQTGFRRKCRAYETTLFTT